MICAFTDQARRNVTLAVLGSSEEGMNKKDFLCVSVPLWLKYKYGTKSLFVFER